MRHFGQVSLLTLSLGLFAVVQLFDPSHSASAQTVQKVPVKAAAVTPSVPVTVVNGPVPVAGSVNANITNAAVPVTGSVNAAVTGIVNTNITNAAVPVTGTVTVSNLPSTSGSVTVANTTTNPVPTVATDNHATTAVVLWMGAAGTTFSLADGSSGTSAAMQNTSGTYTVPTGQRLVVESISGRMSVPTGQKPQASISFYLNSVSGVYYAVPAFITTDGVDDYYSFASQFTAYVDTGAEIVAIFSRYPSTSGAAGINLTVFGHLETIQ